LYEDLKLKQKHEALEQVLSPCTLCRTQTACVSQENYARISKLLKDNSAILPPDVFLGVLNKVHYFDFAHFSLSVFSLSQIHLRRK